MTPVALILEDGTEVPLTDDGIGLSGHVDIDGQRCRVLVTITPSRPAACTPAQWCSRR